MSVKCLKKPWDIIASNRQNFRKNTISRYVSLDNASMLFKSFVLKMQFKIILSQLIYSTYPLTFHLCMSILLSRFTSLSHDYITILHLSFGVLLQSLSLIRILCDKHFPQTFMSFQSQNPYLSHRHVYKPTILSSFKEKN